MRGACKRIEALSHILQAFSHNVHAVSSILVFPPCHDSDPVIPPLLGLDLPCSLLSSWQLQIQMPLEQGGEGQVTCHVWKVLETKLGWCGVPHAAYALYWLPLSFDYWCYLGSCMGAFRCPGPSSSPASSNLFSSAGGRKEKGNLLLAQIFLLVFINCTCLRVRA